MKKMTRRIMIQRAIFLRILMKVITIVMNRSMSVLYNLSSSNVHHAKKISKRPNLKKWKRQNFKS